jgi:diketogulonate reductase-like aldo/keto reductase
VRYKHAMKMRAFGKTGIDVPVLGQGTWQVKQSVEVVRTLTRGIELGMTHIDTAELYTGAEALVAQAIAGRRSAVYLVSKVMPMNASRNGTVAACEQSLQRLQTDYLDCYLLHWNGGSHPLEACMEGMVDLVNAGKIGAVGVSNFNVSEMRRAQAALGDIPLVCNQVRYNLSDRGIEADVLPWCVEHDVAVVGYSPFNVGDFFRPGSHQWTVLEQIGSRHGRSVYQVTLAFLTRHPALFAIPKASTVPHVEDNRGGEGFELTAGDIAEIDAVFAC